MTKTLNMNDGIPHKLGFGLMLSVLLVSSGCASLDDSNATADAGAQEWYVDEMGMLQSGSTTLSEELALVAASLTRQMIPTVVSGRNMRHPSLPARSEKPLVLIMDIENRTGKIIEDHCAIITAIRKTIAEKSKMTVFPDVLPPDRMPAPIKLTEEELEVLRILLPLQPGDYFNRTDSVTAAAVAGQDLYHEPASPRSCGIVEPQIYDVVAIETSEQHERTMTSDGKSQSDGVTPQITITQSSSSMDSVVLSPASIPPTLTPATVPEDATAATSAPLITPEPANPESAVNVQTPTIVPTAPTTPVAPLPESLLTQQHKLDRVLRFIRDRETIAQKEATSTTGDLKHAENASPNTASTARTIYLVKSIFAPTPLSADETPRDQLSLQLIEVRSDTIKWASTYELDRQYGKDGFYAQESANPAANSLPETLKSVVDTATNVAKEAGSLKESISTLRDLKEF